MSHGFRQGLWNSKSVNLFTLMCFKTIVTGSQFCSVTNGCQNIYVSQNTAQVKTGLKSEVIKKYLGVNKTVSSRMIWKKIIQNKDKSIYEGKDQ